ncbi:MULTISPECIES: YgaP family membrane protein [Hymenobacter]|uniref:DUF2892 domain-containing protein n=1 Tax=Hymenobacter jejuensis TaxID=2502781 RepID=A0A5B8A4G2_9BACT|nr:MULTISPECIES: DUF2892 domain-containing protein [Hymenobacter]MBC6990550.1 DUF2892 domain-containing protein [Hymenobacter sp. BT491]QDA61032.1 DUF2892 domain-containing protein [Hymenobacter jejuensis]
MHQNLSSFDRVIRILLATVLTGIISRQDLSTPMLMAWLLLPLALLATGVAGYSPLYALLGISTHRRRPQS